MTRDMVRQSLCSFSDYIIITQINEVAERVVNHWVGFKLWENKFFRMRRSISHAHLGGIATASTLHLDDLTSGKTLVKSTEFHLQFSLTNFS